MGTEIKQTIFMLRTDIYKSLVNGAHINCQMPACKFDCKLLHIKNHLIIVNRSCIFLSAQKESVVHYPDQQGTPPPIHLSPSLIEGFYFTLMDPDKDLSELL